MAYNLKWPGLHDLDIYIIDNETKNIYGKKKELPDRLHAINTLEHKYVRLIDVVSLFPNSMKVRVLNLVETLTSISSLKPLHKDKVSELRFLHLSSLLAFILVYPFCKPFQKTRDAILRFLMDYTETVCMDCGFIQRECQCHVFSSLNDEAGGSDEITEVVCKVSEWKSTGTQTDPSSTTVDTNPTKVILPLPTNFKLKTSDVQIVATAASSGTSSVMSGTIPSIVPQTLIQGPPMYTIPTVTSFPTTFNPLQQMSNMSFNFLGGSTGAPLGSISSAAPNPTLNITPSILPMAAQTMQPAHDPASGSGFKMGNNFVYISPEVLNSENPAHSSEKQDTGKRKNLFRLDPETKLFVSDDFSLDPKTGKVKKNVDSRKEVEGSSETNSSKRRSKKKKHILIDADKEFATEGRNLNDDLVSKRRKKKRKTVKNLLEKEGKEEKSSGDKKETSDLPEKSGNETTSEAVLGDKVNNEETHGEVGDNSVKKDIELDENVTGIENEKRNTEKKPEDACRKVSDESKTATETDKNTIQTEANGEDKVTTDQHIKKVRKDEQTNGLNEHPDSERDTDEGTDGTESTSEGEGSESESISEEDVRVHDGVQYKVISANPLSKANAKPPQLKVKMPFAGKMKPIPIKVKLPQRAPAKSLVASSTPGSILSKCNFSYASSPITGQPVLQQVKKKLKQLNTSDSASGKSNATSKDKACFSVIPHNSTDTGKGYAKFEFAQTGEQMLRCIIYTCGQVFDTEQFAEIHHTLHQHGTPKELRCKLCDFKGHVLKWYDMLRHLKQTHGSVINPKILPPKRKKTDEKQSNEEKKIMGKENNGKKSEKEDEGEKSTGREVNAVVKGDDGTEGSNGLQKSSPIKEQNDLENSTVLANSNIGKGPDETSIWKSDGLSALADVCDQLEPMDTSESSKDTTEVSKLNGDSSASKTESLLDTGESATKIEEKKLDTMMDEQDIAVKVASTPVSNGGSLSSPVKVEEKPEAGKAASEISKGDKEEAANTSLKIEEADHGCDLCGIKFENKKELDTHSTFHYYNKYKCIHCGGIMYTWEHLQRHLKECTDVEKGRVFYNCQYCHLSFRDRKSHYIHSISHGDPGLVCSYCDDDKSWDNWTALKKHYKVFHMAMRLLSAFKCDDCNREFNTAKQYNNHMQDHKRRKERAAKMNKADQKEIDDMKDMEIKVTKDGLVKCPDCEQTFKNNHYMEMHHKFKHGEEISCPKCNYVAKSKLMLKIHMGKVHIEKSHKCGECGKTFAHYHQYKVHLSTHAQKTTFSCKFCQASYPTNGELRQHMFKEHKLPAHKKLIQCEDCDFKCFSRTTLKAHARKNHPETTVVEDGEDHCYFNKKEPSPPPKVGKKTKDKQLKNQESIEKMLETKSKYFIMRHNTCCRTRSFEQNMEIKNRKVAAEKRLFEGPKKRGRKPKSVTETTVVTEDPEVAEKKDPTWSPKKVENLAADPNVQMGAAEKTNRRASCTATPTDDFSQEDIHKIHENRAPNKRRSAPPKRYSPEREIVQVKKRAKSPPMRRPRSPKEKRRTSKSPVYKKRKSLPGTDYDSSLSYLGQQNPLLSSTPYESAQRIKERRRSAKQYEKRLKHEKPTLYAELMHVKKLKSVSMVVDQSASLSVHLLDHCYCRESKPIEQYHDDISYLNPDLSIVTTPDVADFEECLTDDVEIPSPIGTYNRPVYSSNTMTVQHNRRGRGRPFTRGPTRVTERRQQPVAMRAVLSGGSVSTLQLTNNSGQFSKLGSHLSDDFGSGVNVRIAGRNTNMTPSTVSQVRTVMASPSDDSMELDSDPLLPPGVEMQDDILKVAADMFIGESEISEEITEASDSEHHISSSSVGESSPYTITNTIPKYPKPIVIRRPAYEQTSGFSRNRVVTISQHGLTEHSQSRVVAEAIPQLSAEPQSVVAENIPHYSSEDGEATLETVHLDSDEIVTETSPITNAEAYLQGTTIPDHLSQSENVTLSQTDGSNMVPVTAAEDFQNVESEPVIANEMAQELVQAILEHSRTSDTDLDDIHLNEVDYNILLGSRGGIAGNSTTVNNENTIQTTNDCSEQRTRSVDHQYF